MLCFTAQADSSFVIYISHVLSLTLVSVLLPSNMPHNIVEIDLRGQKSGLLPIARVVALLESIVSGSTRRLGDFAQMGFSQGVKQQRFKC
jgi:hypothetical protein